MSAPTRGPVLLRREFLAVAAVFLLLGFLRLNDLFLYTPDGARYLVWGNAIARGEGWLDDTQPEPLRYVVHAPLYPAILAPVELFFPLRPVPAKVWTLLWGLLAIAITYRWIDRESGRAAAVAGAAMLALNPGFLVYSTEVLSEAPFIAFLAAAMLLGTKAARGEELSRREWFVLLAVSSTIGLLREVGAVVPLCLAVALFPRDRRRAYAVVAGAAIALGVWYLRNTVLVGAPEGAPGSNIALAVGQLFGGGGGPSLTDFGSQSRANFAAYLAHAAGGIFHPLYGPQHTLLLSSPVEVPAGVQAAAVLLFGTLIVAGIVRSARRSGVAFLPVGAGLLILAASAVYPVRDTRFVAPLLPLVVSWIVAAFDSSSGAAASGTGTGLRRGILLAAICAAAVLPNIPAIAGIVSLNRRYVAAPDRFESEFTGGGDAPAYYRKPWAVLGKWIDANLPPDAVIASPAKELAVVAGGRKVLELDPGVPQSTFERLLRANGVTHILAPARWEGVRVYDPLLSRSRRVSAAPVADAGGLRLCRLEWKPFADDATAVAPPAAPTGAAGLLARARLLVADERYDDALRALDSAAALEPRRAEILTETIVASTLAGDSARSAAALAALAEIPQAASFLVVARRQAGLAEQASAIVSLPPGPERSMRALDASRALWETGYYDAARTLLEGAAGSDSLFFVGWLWNFHFAFQTGDTVAARAALGFLDRIDSVNSLVRNFHRLTALRRDVRSAADAAARARARLAMAEIDRDIELFDEAFDEGEEALRDDPDGGAPARFLAALHAMRGSPRRALAYYRESARLDPADTGSAAAADSIAASLARW